MSIHDMKMTTVTTEAVSLHVEEQGTGAPALVFLHYWGRGPAAQLAATIKRAVDLTAWDGKHM